MEAPNQEKANIPANRKSLLWLLVVNDKKEASTDTIEATLKGFQALLLNYSEFRYVFTIIHNKDPKKRTHLHAVIELYDKGTKKAVLDTLQALLNVDREQLSLDPSNSPILGVQYLTHKNQPEKEPYSFDEISANNVEELERRYGEAYQDPEEERKRVLFGSKTMGQLLEKMTIDEAKKILPVWKAIKEEQGYDKEGLVNSLNKMREDYCTLYDLTGKVFEILELQLFKDDKKTFEALFGGLKAVYEDFLPF